MQKLEKASSVEREALGLIAQQEQEAIDHQQRVFDDLECTLQVIAGETDGLKRVGPGHPGLDLRRLLPMGP